LKFLPRHGYRYEEEGNRWTVKHWKWMDGIVFKHEYEKEVYSATQLPQSTGAKSGLWRIG
jgi:hypothetical protein